MKHPAIDEKQIIIIHESCYYDIKEAKIIRHTISESRLLQRCGRSCGN
jgi:hypothetical protein